MKRLKTVHLIGCGVLAPDIRSIAEELGLNLKMNFMPGGLHDKPQELRVRLQAAIDGAARDEDCYKIVVGYGICGRGTVGIIAPHLPLVFPKVHDCIALFMGSDQAYREEFARYPGTFYLSAGWCKEKERPGKSRERDGKDEEQTIWIGSEPMGSLELKEKYGEEGGSRIIDFFSSWQKNYQRAAFIDTGLGNCEKYAQQAKKMAERYKWKYEKIEGDSSLLRTLLTQDYSDDTILIVPPGHCTIYSPFKNSLDSAPFTNGEKIRAGLIHNDVVSSGLSIQSMEEGRGPLVRYGLGIDAGGTYTDAVIYDFKEKRITDKHKALTTKWNFSIGIDNALSGLESKTLSMVELVSVSTTLATNAIVEGEGQKTGLILMNSAGVVSDDLIAHTPKRNIKGNINISGEEVEPVDQDEVIKVVREMVSQESVTAFAVSGFGGSINSAHELLVKQIIEQESGMVVCCGHELSDLLNFVVRAQTAVLNARIIPRMVKFFREIDQVLEKRGIAAPVMVVKGDGTLMSGSMARERPVETILSGPAASVAGAKLLTGLSDAMVVDMGGTTTDTADICENMVAVCESGAHVGGFITHVKALDMRTAGLGGDSLIRWKRGELTIGPRRVAPLVWAGEINSSGVDQALFHMEQRPLTHLEQVLFIAMESGSPFEERERIFPFRATEQEAEIYRLLCSRPHTPEELAAALNCLSPLFLPMERLEESGLVQRCGLTPTDLLHVRGDFRKWGQEPARRVVQMIASFNRTTVPEIVDELLKRVQKRVALEILKKLILKDARSIDRNGAAKNEINESEIENSPLAKHLIASMLEPSRNSRYQIKAEFRHPVIGIGAPVHYFLPLAGEILNARVIIPPDADVANALGAITSHIMVRQKVVIRPDSAGRFVVEGVAGNQGFNDIERAESWAVKYLKRSVISQAVKAGTSRKEVTVEISDRVVDTGNGLSLFLERTIAATLTGSPDLVVKSCMNC